MYDDCLIDFSKDILFFSAIFTLISRYKITTYIKMNQKLQKNDARQMSVVFEFDETVK